MHRMMTTFAILCALILALAAGGSFATPTDYFRVTVIVDMTTDPVSREQAEAVLALANEKMIALTGFGLQLHDFVEDYSGGSIASIAENYMQRASSLPNGILIFSVGDDDRARINRAYARQIPAPDGFRNTFVSPYLGDGHMYIAILQFNYLYAACGYAGTDTIQSPVSSGGECPGGDGQVCAAWEGLQVCPVALPVLEGHTPVDLASGVVIHEFMHGFGAKGAGNHYTSAACHETMGWKPDHFVLDEAEYYNDFCPNVYDIFRDSYRP